MRWSMARRFSSRSAERSVGVVAEVGSSETEDSPLTCKDGKRDIATVRNLLKAWRRTGFEGLTPCSLTSSLGRSVSATFGSLICLRANLAGAENRGFLVTPWGGLAERPSSLINAANVVVSIGEGMSRSEAMEKVDLRGERMTSSEECMVNEYR